MTNRRVLTSVLCAAAVAAPMIVSIPQDGWSQVDQIIVTTRKREENLQRVPLSVQAFSADTLTRQGVDDIKDIANLSSSIEFDQGFSAVDTRVVIRGLAPTRGRPNVATLIDGIDISSEALNFSGGSLLLNPRIMDVERIEIVKGPQSALYGRSAFAGAIQYITKDAPEEVEFEGSVDIGNYGQREVKLGVGGQIVDGILGARISGLYYNEDGFYENRLTGGSLGGADGYGGTLKINFTPTPDLNIEAWLAYSDDEFEPLPDAALPSEDLLPFPAEAIALNPALAFATFPTFVGAIPDGDSLFAQLSPDPRTGDDYPGFTREVFRANLVAEWDVGIATLSSYTGYATSEQTQFFDLGRTAVPGPTPGRDFARLSQELNDSTDTTLITQEFRFASDWDFPVQLTLGGLFWFEDAENTQNNVTCLNSIVTTPPLPPDCADLIPLNISNPPNQPTRFIDRETRHGSFYWAADLDVNDLFGDADLGGQWKLTFEGRYVDEETELTGPNCGVVSTGSAEDACAFGGPGTFAILSFLPFPFPPIGFPIPGGQAILGPTPAAFGFVTDTISDSYWTPKITLEWGPTDDLLLYAYWAQAQKPAGFSTTQVGSAGFRPMQDTFDAEKLTEYEIGIKSTWLDGQLLFNAAAFYEDFSDKQVGVQELLPGGILGNRIINASAAEVYGFEFDAVFAPEAEILGGRVTIGGSYTYLDAEYTEFRFQTNGTGDIARSGTCFDPEPSGGAVPLCTVDFSGNSLEDSPKHALVGQVSYSYPWTDAIDLILEVDTRYTGKRFLELSNLSYVQSFVEMDFRAGLSGETWDILFYMDNALDNDTIKSAFTGPGIECCAGFGPTGFAIGELVVARLPNPRTFGVRASIKFNP